MSIAAVSLGGIPRVLGHGCRFRASIALVFDDSLLLRAF